MNSKAPSPKSESPESEALWKVLDKDFLTRSSRRAVPEPGKTPFESWAKEILSSNDPPKAFLDKAKHMLSTGSAAERRRTAEAIAHNFGAEVGPLIAYLKARGALWKGLRKGDEPQRPG